MHRLRKSAVAVAILAFAWSVTMAASPAMTGAQAANEDVRNTVDWGSSDDVLVRQPGEGGQDVLTWVSREETEGVSRTAGVWAADGMFHMIGGNCQAHVTHPTEQIYDPVSNTWSEGLTHPVGQGGGVHNHDVCAIGDKIYVGSGNNANGYYGRLTVIDVSAGTWTSVTSMPVSSLVRYSFAEYYGLIYCFGGADNSSHTFKTVFQFDPARGTWIVRDSMPAARCNPICVPCGDTIYVIGGFAQSSNSNGTTTMWKYCPYTDEWTDGPAFPAGSGWGRGVAYVDSALGPVIALIGGCNSTGAMVNTVATYSVRTGVWGSETPLLGIRRSHAADISSDGVIFVAGGYNGGMLGTSEMATALPGVAEPGPASGLPMRLAAVCPNPVKGSATVSYALAAAGRVSLVLYDAAGRVAANLVETEQAVGEYRLNVSVANLARGVYLLELRTAGASTTAKLVVN